MFSRSLPVHRVEWVLWNFASSAEISCWTQHKLWNTVAWVSLVELQLSILCQQSSFPSHPHGPDTRTSDRPHSREWLCHDVSSTTAQEKVPFSHTSAHGSGACCYDYGTRESPWVLWNVAGIWMEEFAQRPQQLGTQVGQQRAVIEHQQEQLMRQRTTIDAERATRTPVNLCPRRQSKLGWPQSWKRAGDVRGWKSPVGRLVIQNATVHLSGRRRALRGACGMWKRIRFESCPCLAKTSCRRDERDSLRSCWQCIRKIEHSRWSRNWAIQVMDSISGDVFWKSGSRHTEGGTERC